MAAGREGDLIRECVLRYVGDIQRRLERGNHDMDGLDYIVFRIDWIISILVRYLGTTGVDPRVIDPLREVKDTITAGHWIRCHTAGTLFTGLHGRPKFNIPKEQLQFLIEQGFPSATIADILGVSRRTVER